MKHGTNTDANRRVLPLPVALFDQIRVSSGFHLCLRLLPRSLCLLLACRRAAFLRQSTPSPARSGWRGRASWHRPSRSSRSASIAGRRSRPARPARRSAQSAGPANRPSNYRTTPGAKPRSTAATTAHSVPSTVNMPTPMSSGSTCEISSRWRFGSCVSAHGSSQIMKCQGFVQPRVLHRHETAPGCSSQPVLATYSPPITTQQAHHGGHRRGRQRGVHASP